MRTIRWDAPFWGGLVVALFSLGALGCLGIAAAQTTGSADADIVAVDRCSPSTDL
jgi:hypothetical protein